MRWKTLLQDAATAAKAAREIAEKATAENREMTSDERRDYDAKFAEAKSLKTKSDQAKHDQTVMDDAERLVGGLGPLGPAGTAGASAWATAAADKIRKTGDRYGVKALTTGSIDVPNLVEAEVVAFPQNPRRLIDVLVNRAPLTGNAFEYLRQTARDNNAAPVPDGALKPTSIYTVEPVEDRARVVAHLSEPIPERYFADASQLVDFLDSEMREGVLQALETEAIAGDGTGEHFEGILGVSGTVAIPFATDIPTTARKAITNRQVLGEVPNAWLLNPADLETVDLLKDAELRYYGSALDPLFGELPKLYSVGVPAGTAILGDFMQVKLWVREDIRLDADRSGDNFTHNQVVLRAEGRFGFGVLRPQAFAIVDLTT